ncbi:MAG: hypothetical protein E6G78_11130 [Alphaproteobacteria bacterium]|nr:MAG: hypothetical protein E6G78_11130 [Alphaproteobacteria bacterium]
MASLPVPEFVSWCSLVSAPAKTFSRNQDPYPTSLHRVILLLVGLVATASKEHEMNQQGQWQVAGSAPEVYERELVLAVFGAWAPILVELATRPDG